MATWNPKSFGMQRSVTLVRLLLLSALPVLLLLAMLTVGYYTDWLWFESLGFGGVYVTVLFTQIALFVAASLDLLRPPRAQRPARPTAGRPLRAPDRARTRTGCGPTSRG